MLVGERRNTFHATDESEGPRQGIVQMPDLRTFNYGWNMYMPRPAILDSYHPRPAATAFELAPNIGTDEILQHMMTTTSFPHLLPLFGQARAAICIPSHAPTALPGLSALARRLATPAADAEGFARLPALAWAVGAGAPLGN